MNRPWSASKPGWVCPSTQPGACMNRPWSASKPGWVCPSTQLGVCMNRPRCASEPGWVCPSTQPGLCINLPRCAHNPSQVCQQTHPGFSKSDLGIPKSEIGIAISRLSWLQKAPFDLLLIFPPSLSHQPSLQSVDSRPSLSQLRVGAALCSASLGPWSAVLVSRLVQCFGRGMECCRR